MGIQKPFYISPERIDHPYLTGQINYLNFILHCHDYLREAKNDILDYWGSETQNSDFKLGQYPYQSVPLFKEMVELQDKINSYLRSTSRLKNVNGEDPSLIIEDINNPYLFGDCSNLRGFISKDLSGDVSNLRGELRPDLRGRVSPFLKGDITGLYGDLYALEGTINKHLIGDISGIRGTINSKLKGDISHLFGHIHPHLKGDCTGLSGMISKLTGDCSNISGRLKINGDCSGLFGDCSGLSGDCTGISGDLSVIPYECRPNLIERLPDFAWADKIKLND